MFHHLRHHEAGRSQSQPQPLPDRKRNWRLPCHPLPLAPPEPICLCFPLIVPLSSAHMSLPYPWTPTALAFHDGEPEREEICPRSHSKKSLRTYWRFQLGPFLGPQSLYPPRMSPSHMHLSRSNQMPPVLSSMHSESLGLNTT